MLSLMNGTLHVFALGNVKFHRISCEFIFRPSNVANCLFLHTILITDGMTETPDSLPSKFKFFTDS